MGTVGSSAGVLSGVEAVFAGERSFLFLFFFAASVCLAPSSTVAAALVLTTVGGGRVSIVVWRGGSTWNTDACHSLSVGCRSGPSCIPVVA